MTFRANDKNWTSGRQFSVIITLELKTCPYLRSSLSTQEVGRNTRRSRVFFPYTSFVLQPLPASFTTEQNTVKASLHVKW